MEISEGVIDLHKTIAHLLKIHTRAAQYLRVPARVSDVEGGAVWTIKRAHLAISMERRGPLACGLLPQLWVTGGYLVVAYRRGSRTMIEAREEVRTNVLL